MNKTILALVIFAFCLFPQALSQNLKGTDRELGSISLGNLGTLFGNLINSVKNANNSTSSTNPTTPVNNTPTTNTTVPANNTSSGNTTVPANNSSSPSNTTSPVQNNTTTNTTAPVNTTTPANTTTPVSNNTSTNTTVPANDTSSGNTTAPVNNSITNSTVPSDGVDSSNNSTNTTIPVDPVTPVDPPVITPPINNNWYARNDVDRAAFKQKCLDIHNILRGAVGVAPVTWSDSLAASAQAWADNMAVYGFRHSGRTGENIASTSYSTKVTVRLLGLWTKEQDWFIKGCTYPRCSSTGAEVGHYTQMVWAKTTQVGCGFAPGVNKQWNYLCCQYYRAGNVIGQTVFPYTAPAV